MDEFVSRLNNLRELRDKQKKRDNVIGNIKLLIFVAGGIATYYFMKNGKSSYGYTVATAALILFVIFVIKHSNIAKKLKRTEAAIVVNQSYQSRMKDDWMSFKDGGEEFINANHEYSSDLDIFGPKSLFKWINVGYTFYGRKVLSELLRNPDKDIEKIKKRQGAVREMESKLDFCIQLQCEGILSREAIKDPEEILKYAEDSRRIINKSILINLFYLLPFVTILSWALYIYKYPIPIYIPLGTSLIQILLTGVGYIMLLPTLNSVYKFKNNIEVYKNIIELIEKEKFDNPLLSGLKLDFFENDKSASQRLKNLERIVDAIDIRYSPIIYFVLNISLLWDFHCVFALEEWKKSNGHLIRTWFNNIGYFEAVSSLSVILKINQDWNFPVFLEDALGFNAKEMGHPLILGDKRVSNSIEVKNNLCVITGSNMSGKTTLLRTIGINLVLAYAGAPVCAKEFECSIMSIFTSMRITDDLNSGISTFYAELIRIKMIVEYSKKGLPMIFLIDELFRGTNSRDRIIGARNLIKNLSRDWIIGLISTHDFELCELEREGISAIENYHFTERYSNDKIMFDYKLLRGRSTTTNAKYLMKMVGIEFLD